MRALAGGPASVADLQQKLAVTQGAISQSLKLMHEDGLIEKEKGQDARRAIVSLSAHGQAVRQELEPRWDATFAAIESLEREIQRPLIECLTRSVAALEKKPFATRIHESDARYLCGSNDPRTMRAAHEPRHAEGQHYAQFRPTYPADLAASLAAVAANTETALDVGCGNGQLTSLLAPHFQQVIGIDASEKQLAAAEPATNVSYRRHAAEDTGLPDKSVDLIVVAQAAHWFDLERFYSEVQRVAKRTAVIALVSYGVPYISDSVNATFQQGYWRDTHDFWPPERRHVETGYADLYFPFHRIEFPSHSCTQDMYVDELIGYITTWTAYAVARKKRQLQPFELFFERLRSQWHDSDPKTVHWPISVKAARVN
jgi:SAM-dependent methyltransferase/DNA-binding MarR family transcriptional regulator